MTPHWRMDVRVCLALGLNKKDGHVDCIEKTKLPRRDLNVGTLDLPMSPE